MSLKINNNQVSFLVILCILYLSLYELVLNNQYIIYFILILGLILQLYNLYFLKLDRKIYLFQLLLLGFGTINYFLFSNYSLFTLLRTVLVSYNIAVYFLFSNQIKSKLNSIHITIFAINVLYFIFLAYGQYQLFPTMSRNYVSVFLIFLLFLILLVKKNENLNIFSVLSVFLISALFFGRGGILSTGVMLFLVIILKIYLHIVTKNKLKLAMYTILFFLSSIVILTLISFEHFEYLFSKYLIRFFSIDVTVKNSNIERIKLLNLYYNNIKDNIYYFIFGGDMDIITEGIRGSHNLHNSYFQLHAHYGLGIFLISLVSILISIKEMVFRKQYYLLIILLVFLIRATTDTIFPNNMFDIMFFYFVLFYYKKT